MNNDFFNNLEDNKKDKKEILSEKKVKEITIKNNVNNMVAKVFKNLAWVILIIGGILGLITFEFSIINLLMIWLATGIVFLFIYSFGEIIEILHDIRLKIWSDK